MGNCIKKESADMLQNIEFSNKANLKIKARDYHGKVIGNDRVTFNLTHPSLIVGRTIDLGEFKNFHITGGIVPGLDPRRMMEKECQDNLFFIEIEGAFLTTLFDGHGKEGLKVVDFCVKYMTNFFKTHHLEFKDDPILWIQKLIESCDEEIRNDSSGVDSTISGTTAVCVYINQHGIFTGSVGDSRAILGAIPDHNEEIYSPTSPVQDNRFVRKVQPTRNLTAIALTVDQKPNHQEELERIKKSGGRVQRLTDERGNKVGPYRVWRKHSNIPGLAMSRSIGDSVATSIGVISTPILNSFDFVDDKDQFIVLASDGVWDVMDNFEVVHFVEKFRRKTLRTPELVNYPVRSTATTIAHLLCEEARYRWFGIVEEEDVMIDDISVIVIEINSIEPPGRPSEIRNRRTEKIITLREVDEPDTDTENKDLVISSKRSDPRRGSFVPKNKTSVVRRDPTRGSTITSHTPIDEESLEKEELDNKDSDPPNKSN